MNQFLQHAQIIHLKKTVVFQPHNIRKNNCSIYMRQKLYLLAFSPCLSAVLWYFNNIIISKPIFISGSTVFKLKTTHSNHR